MTPAAPIPAPSLNRAAEAVQRVMNAAVSAGEFPCAAAAVFTTHGEALTSVASGTETAHPDSLFMVASITKLFTSTLIWQLVAEGKLLLSEPVSRFVPAFSGDGRDAVTIRHLLTHTSGLREDQALIMAAGLRGEPPAHQLELACTAPLDFTPGSAFRYTNLSFVLLAETIARLTGRPYPEAMRERILKPLNLKDTAFTATDPTRAAPVHGFGPDAHLAYFQTLEAPAGGLWSSAADLTRFGQALLNGGAPILAPAALRAATRRVRRLIREDGTHADYATGFGKGSRDLLTGEHAFGHGGATGSFLWLDPDLGLGVALLANVWDSPSNWNVKAVNAAVAAL